MMQDGDKNLQKSRFVSWRWRLMLPIFAVLVVIVMLSVYLGMRPEIVTGADVSLEALRFQIGRLLVSLLMGGLVIAFFVGANVLLNRVERVSDVAQALATGQRDARTGMSPTDEVGILGNALDRYADRVQARQDAMNSKLRKFRRENAYLMSVLETLPDAVIVQDIDGRVVLINDLARELLGAEALNKNDLDGLTAVVTDAVGMAFAPGVYALGDPKQILMGDKMISAQAAAVMMGDRQRVGTVIVLRDISDEVRRDQARDALLNRMMSDVQTPMLDAVQRGARQPAVSEWAREMSRNAATLQHLIAEMRELTADFKRQPQPRQRSLLLETLVWAVANEWQQVAQAANLTLQVQIDQTGMYILGDDRRLRWAIGNLIDNAVKYTPPGGRISLEIRGESNGRAELRVRDNGVGIAEDELPQVFTRFYRGNPVTEGGRSLLVAGSGQGLTIAKQIIEVHGGVIAIKSTRHVGTAVTFALPLTAPVSMELPLQPADMEGETVRLTRHL